jgi:hypothetical protein
MQTLGRGERIVGLTLIPSTCMFPSKTPTPPRLTRHRGGVEIRWIVVPWRTKLDARTAGDLRSYLSTLLTGPFPDVGPPMWIANWISGDGFGIDGIPGVEGPPNI